LLMFLGYFELTKMFLKKNIKMFLPLAAVLLILTLSNFFTSEILPYMFFGTMGIFYILKHREYELLDLIYSLFGLFYVYFFSFIAQLRQFGFDLFLYYFLIIWANDTFAYFVGKIMGKHKIAPNLSPKKSMEGAIGGIVGALIIGYLGKYWLNGFTLSLLPGVLITAVVAQIGDFLESAIKRFAGVKDSGEILPGHGGILDRFDGVLLSAPFFYYYFNIFTR